MATTRDVVSHLVQFEINTSPGYFQTRLFASFFVVTPVYGTARGHIPPKTR
jgi:hypothetical protein